MSTDSVPVCNIPGCGVPMELIPPYLHGGSVVSNKYRCRCCMRPRTGMGDKNCEHRRALLRERYTKTSSGRGRGRPRKDS